MTRTENDLREALTELERRADEHGAPSTTGILTRPTGAHPGPGRHSAGPRFPRWFPPLAAAALVAAAAVVAVTLSTSNGSPAHRPAPPAADAPTTALHHSRPAAHRSVAPRVSPAATVLDDAAAKLDDAAAKLDAAPAWKTPAAQDFFYVHTNEVTTWASVSGTQPGAGHNAHGSTTVVPGCKNGEIVSSGESGPCTLNDVSHYLSDAPTAPAAWDAYLEGIAPGAKAADAQGKIIVQVLHEDLTAPKAAAALLRYTATSCPGLHTLDVHPINGEKLIGVTCASMTNGSYALVFDATSHTYVGFVTVAGSGQQSGSAEIILRTGIVSAIGQTP